MNCTIFLILEHFVKKGKKLFKIEADIVANSSTEYIIPSKELLKFSLKRMFDQPRNMWQSPKFREHVGSYIFERLARAGLVVTIHDFKHEAPLKKFAESQGDFGVPVRLIYLYMYCSNSTVG